MHQARTQGILISRLLMYEKHKKEFDVEMQDDSPLMIRLLCISAQEALMLSV